MAVARIEALLPYPAETVWHIVTDCTRCDWRSDLDRIETHGDGSFTEYTKSGYATRFTVTESVPCSRWAFRLENDSLSGTWTGLFEARDSGTRIVFEENVSVKKLWMKPFAGFYLRRQQNVYLRDLRRALARC